MAKDCAILHCHKRETQSAGRPESVDYRWFRTTAVSCSSKGLPYDLTDRTNVLLIFAPDDHKLRMRVGACVRNGSKADLGG